MNYVKELFNKNEKLLFLGMVICLTAWGLAVLAEASYYHSLRIYETGYFILVRQAIFIALGFLVFALIQKIELNKFLKLPYLWLLVAAILPALVHIQILAHKVRGATCWIGLPYMGGYDTIVIHTGLWSITCFFIAVLIFNSNEQDWTKLQKRIVTAAACWIAIMLLDQPDFMFFIYLYSISVYYLFINGRSKTAWAFVLLLFALAACYFFLGAEYRLGRLKSWYELSDTMGASYQMIQSRFAFFHGKIFGVGFGESISSRLNLPDAHGSFIFSVLAEISGLIGVALFLVAIISFYCFGMRAVSNVNNKLEASVMKFFVYLIITFAFSNIAMTVHLVPIYTVQLPFVSYGGAFVLITLCISGWIYKNLPAKNKPDNSAPAIKVFYVRKPLSLTVIVVAIILFIRAVHISYAAHPAFPYLLKNANELVNMIIK